MSKLTKAQENLYMAVGRAWVHPKNAHKEIDSDLADALVIEIEKELERQKKELVKHLKEKFTQGFHEVEISYEDLDQAIETIKEGGE